MHFFPGQLRVGIEFGAANIIIAALRTRGKSHKLDFIDVMNLPRKNGVLEQSQLHDEIYVETLQKLIDKYRLKNARVRATLPSKNAVIQKVTIPFTTCESEINSAIEEAFRQKCAQQIGELKIVYHLFEQGEDENQLSLLACAIPRDVVEKYLNILENGGLKATVLDLDAFGIYNAIHHIEGSSFAQPFAVVHIRFEYSVCIIISPNRHPLFFIINPGSDLITKSIMKEWNLNFMEAEELKYKMPEIKKKAIPENQRNKFNEIFYDFTAKIIYEIKRCLLHFQSYEGIADFDKLYLTGNDSKLILKKNLLNENLKVEAAYWNPLLFFNEDVPQEIQMLVGMHFTPVLGCLLRGD